ncbi:lysophospholipase D GDPD1 [Exaiptasia diaphana]|uniref:GP-PDE domain-containing protein n=1 Tax=Exaiptasia diaphana TaxID=2652724 RepID=A0A913WV14_EXADI|nr:lysophospholipase D GDPD1 [Exaiptasia diaphana]KXJ27763.1 Glycerophosphodiester phosphodiesterase domain-containing protein 1 [Exaiptasia diaphana]
MYQYVLPVVLPLFGGYVLSSFILFRCPEILHNKKKTKFRCRHISHRGGAGENRENTIAAFKHAVRLGTEMLEIDLQLTADKQVVVCHDNNLSRVAGVDCNISDLDYKDLPPLLEKIPVQFHPGAISHPDNNDRDIPLLSTVFEAFPDIPINIDIKYDSDELIEKTNELICKYEREHLCAWGNVNSHITERCHRHNSNIPLIFSLHRCGVLLLLYYTGLLPFIPIKESYLEVMLPKVMLRRFEVSGKLRMICYIADWLLIRPSLFKHLEKRGIQTYLWVLNDEDEFELAFDELKVAGVMTDYPTKLSKYLRQNIIFSGE